MAICGHCGRERATIEHVKACSTTANGRRLRAPGTKLAPGRSAASSQVDEGTESLSWLERLARQEELQAERALTSRELERRRAAEKQASELIAKEQARISREQEYRQAAIEEERLRKAAEEARLADPTYQELQTILADLLPVELIARQQTLFLNSNEQVRASLVREWMTFRDLFMELNSATYTDEATGEARSAVVLNLTGGQQAEYFRASTDERRVLVGEWRRHHRQGNGARRSIDEWDIHDWS
jgi:hypothetical protein